MRVAIFFLHISAFIAAFFSVFCCSICNECMDGSRIGLNSVPLNDH